MFIQILHNDTAVPRNWHSDTAVHRNMCRTVIWKNVIMKYKEIMDHAYKAPIEYCEIIPNVRSSHGGIGIWGRVGTRVAESMCPEL